MSVVIESRLAAPCGIGSLQRGPPPSLELPGDFTAMETAEVPQALQHTWSGHARTHVSERYKKLLRQREWRLEWAEKVGMGFDLTAQPVGLRGLLIQFPKTG